MKTPLHQPKNALHVSVSLGGSLLHAIQTEPSALLVPAMLTAHVLSAEQHAHHQNKIGS